MSRAIEWPTAREVAVAIVAAARLCGEDPVAIAEGAVQKRSRYKRGRYLAFAALRDAFPSAPKAPLARCCGFGKSANNAAGNLKAARQNSEWWRDDHLAMVAAALAGAEDGSGAVGRGQSAVGGPAAVARLVCGSGAGSPAAPPAIRHSPFAIRHPRPEPPPASFGLVGALELHMRPDAPAEARGAALVTAALMGDPPPGLSALDRRKAEAAGVERPSRIRIAAARDDGPSDEADS
jgi:hypothetical protein